MINRNDNADDHWFLDTAQPDAGWKSLAPMPHARGHFSTTVVDGLIYAIGGQYHHDRGREDLAFVDVYDPADDEWRALPPIPEPTSHHEGATVLYDGLIVVLGGRNDSPRNYLTPPRSNRTLASPLSWVYDIEDESWRRGPNLPMGLLGAFAVRRENTLVLGGGSSFDSRFPQLTMYSLDFSEASPL